MLWDDQLTEGEIYFQGKSVTSPLIRKTGILEKYSSDLSGSVFLI